MGGPAAAGFSGFSFIPSSYGFVLWEEEEWAKLKESNDGEGGLRQPQRERQRRRILYFCATERLSLSLPRPRFSRLWQKDHPSNEANERCQAIKSLHVDERKQRAGYGAWRYGGMGIALCRLHWTKAHALGFVHNHFPIYFLNYFHCFVVFSFSFIVLHQSV